MMRWLWKPLLAFVTLSSLGCDAWNPLNFLSRIGGDEWTTREAGVTEVILVQDLTNGYDEHLKALGEEGLVRLDAFIDEMGWALKVGLVSFQDKPIWPNGNDGRINGYSDYCAKFEAQPRIDWRNVRNWYRSASSQGGGDPKENQFGALVLAVQGGIFMGETDKIIVLMTDSEPHFAGDGSLDVSIPPFSGSINWSNTTGQCIGEDYPSYKDVVLALQHLDAHVLFFITDDDGPEGRTTSAWKWVNAELGQDESHIYNLDRQASMFYYYLSDFISKLHRPDVPEESTSTIELLQSTSPIPDISTESDDTEYTADSTMSDTVDSLLTIPVPTVRPSATLPSLPVTHPTLRPVSQGTYSAIQLPTHEGEHETTASLSEVDRDLAACLTAIGTTVYLPHDPSYYVWNVPYNMQMSPGNPPAVVLARETEEVAEAVKCAVQFNYKVIPRSGGHDYASYTAGNEQSLVIDLRNMNQWYIDTDNGVGMVGVGMQIGVLWYWMLLLTQRFLPSGACTTLGAGGHILGGGYGFFTRQYGLAVDYLTGVEMVLADGRIVTADASNEPDLYWAMAGSGNGNFGIATKLHVKVDQAPPTVTTISFYWLASDFPVIMKAANEFVEVIDPKLSFSLTATVTGIMLKGAYIGTKAEMREALQPFLAKVGTPFMFHDQGDMLRAAAELSIVDLMDAGTPVGVPLDEVSDLMDKVKDLFGGRQLLEAPTPDGRKVANERELGKYKEPTRTYFRARSVMFTEDHPLTDEGIAVMTEAVKTGNPLFGLAIELLGGNGSQLKNHTSTARTSWAWRNCTWVVHWYSRSYVPLPDYSIDQTDVLYNKLAQKSGPAVYVNYHDRGLSNPLRSYYGPNLERLEEIKGRYDPTNVFSFGQSIPPPSSAR